MGIAYSLKDHIQAIILIIHVVEYINDITCKQVAPILLGNAIIDYYFYDHSTFILYFASDEYWKESI